MQRFMLAALILLQAMAFGYMTEDHAYCIGMGIVVVFGIVSNYQADLSWPRELIVSLALALPFVSLWRLFPGYGPDVSGLLDVRLTYAMGQYLLLLQVIHLFIRREEALPPWLVVLGVITFICAGNVYTAGGHYLVYRILCVVYAVGGIVFLMLGKRFQLTVEAGRSILGKHVLAGGLLAVGLGIALVSGQALQRYQTELDRMLFSLVRSSVRRQSTGFSRDARLGSVNRLKRDGSQGVALRIFSDVRPGYMRGQAYTRYSDSAWKAVARTETLRPSKRFSPDGPENVFVWGKRVEELGPPMQVWPVADIGEGMFAPLGSIAVRAPTQAIEVDDNNIVSSETLVRGVPYSSYQRDKRSKEERAAIHGSLDYLELPSADPEVQRIAQRVFSGSSTAREKVRAVVRYFHQNYSYSLGVQIPSGRDPMTYFLTERPDAHCEYFASGAAILLRLADVPTRYVAGYLVTEQNSMGGYWVARHKDAHAWVEAFIPGQGWMTVEATPSGGVPQPAEQDTATQLLDYLKYKMQQIMANFHIYGVKGLVRWIAASAHSAFQWLLSADPLSTGLKLLILLGLASFLVWRWPRKGWRTDNGHGKLSQLQHLLQRMDERLDSYGVVRPEHQTLHQFARRIREEAENRPDSEQLSRWYRQYAEIRYGEPVTAEAIELLRNDMPEAK